MSTEALEQILRLDFQASENSESDINAILYISGVIAKRKELSAGSDVDAAWEQFKTKYFPYADGRSLYDFDDGDSAVSKPAEESRDHPAKAGVNLLRHQSRHLLRLRRWMTAAVIVFACLFGGVMVAQAVGIDVLGAIGRWTDETFQFVFTGSREPSTRGADAEYYEEVKAVLNEWGGNEDLFPTWHPDGFAAQEPRITNNGKNSAITMSFVGNDRSYSVRILHFDGQVEATGIFEKSSGPVEEYAHNEDYLFYILSNATTITATYCDERFMTIIDGTLTMDEVKTMIDSIGGE